MLPKKNRTNKVGIDKIFKQGKVIFSDNLSFKYINCKEKESSTRVSFIAPKAVSKKAVGRNQLRRRGYSVLEKYLGRFPSGILGAFIFGKKSMQVFGGRKTKKFSPIKNLENEIKIIFNKIH